jgi:type II secretion system protein H
MPRDRSTCRPAADAGRAGFTLIELILVMALLLTVLAIAAPALARFFRGRELDVEARRFVALTRHAQARAIHEGTPMLLWLDLRERRYGLEAESSYLDVDPQATTFTLADTVELELDTPAADNRPPAMASTGADRVPVLIRFRPDGRLDEYSPEWIRLRQGDTDALWIGLNRNRLYYEITTNNLPRAGQRPAPPRS